MVKPPDKSLSDTYNRPHRGISPRTLVLAFLTIVTVSSIAAGTVAFVMVHTTGGAETTVTTTTLNESPDRPIVINGTAGTANRTKLYQETLPSVVSIYAIHEDGSSSQGSGFVYDDKGHIVTNWHVTKGATKYYIRYANGDWSTATLTGTDAYTDLAVLNPNSTPAYADPLPLADRLPKPGEPVIAVGSPHDLRGTITTGVVSGVERSMRTRSGFLIPDTIQTDASLNPGNSGGPLISMDGKVVGVNRARQGDNIGFAISSRLTEPVVESLIADGKHHHPYIGMRGLGLTPRIAEANGLDTVHGVMVTSVMEGTPADGVLRGAKGQVTTENNRTLPRGGDVIVAIDGHPVRTNEDLSSYLMRKTTPGETVTITVLRDGERVNVSLTLGKRPTFSNAP